MNAHEPSSSDSGQPLCPKSQHAIDALIDAGFDPGKVDPASRPCCEKVAGLLGCLRTATPFDAAYREHLIAAAAARIAASPRRQPAANDVFELCEDDAEALDVLVNERYEPRRVPNALRERAARQLALMGLLENAGAATHEARETLVQATLTRVRTDVSAESRRMNAAERLAPRGRGLRLTDLAGVAAMLLIGGSILIPSLGAMRRQAQQTACNARMAGIGQAMAQYNTDFRSMPMASASIAGSTWWNVGRAEQSNSANLFTLKRTGYAPLAQLTCCANQFAAGCCPPAGAMDWSRAEEVSYSFQNLFTTHRPKTLEGSPRFIVLADRSPIVLRILRGERVIDVNENSPNHEGRGQNALFSDGSADWLTRPITRSGDHIWLPAGIEALFRAASRPRVDGQVLQGVEEPARPDDAFLCP